MVYILFIINKYKYYIIQLFKDFITLINNIFKFIIIAIYLSQIYNKGMELSKFKEFHIYFNPKINNNSG